MSQTTRRFLQPNEKNSQQTDPLFNIDVSRISNSKNYTKQLSLMNKHRRNLKSKYSQYLRRRALIRRDVRLNEHECKVLRDRLAYDGFKQHGQDSAAFASILHHINFENQKLRAKKNNVDMEMATTINKYEDALRTNKFFRGKYSGEQTFAQVNAIVSKRNEKLDNYINYLQLKLHELEGENKMRFFDLEQNYSAMSKDFSEHNELCRQYRDLMKYITQLQELYDNFKQERDNEHLKAIAQEIRKRALDRTSMNLARQTERSFCRYGQYVQLMRTKREEYITDNTFKRHLVSNRVMERSKTLAIASQWTDALEDFAYDEQGRIISHYELERKTKASRQTCDQRWEILRGLFRQLGTNFHWANKELKAVDEILQTHEQINQVEDQTDFCKSAKTIEAESKALNDVQLLSHDVEELIIYLTKIKQIICLQNDVENESEDKISSIDQVEDLLHFIDRKLSILVVVAVHQHLQLTTISKERTMIVPIKTEMPTLNLYNHYLDLEQQAYISNLKKSFNDSIHVDKLGKLNSQLINTSVRTCCLTDQTTADVIAILNKTIRASIFSKLKAGMVQRRIRDHRECLSKLDSSPLERKTEIKRLAKILRTNDPRILSSRLYHKIHTDQISSSELRFDWSHPFARKIASSLNEKDLQYMRALEGRVICRSADYPSRLDNIVDNSIALQRQYNNEKNDINLDMTDVEWLVYNFVNPVLEFYNRDVLLYNDRR